MAKRASKPRRRVLFVASECYPLIKTGGLADVVGALPLALKAHGWATRVVLPAYPQVKEKLGRQAKLTGELDAFGTRVRLYEAEVGGLDVIAVDSAGAYDRPGVSPYQDGAGRDWHDNHLRFALLARVAADIALGKLPDWVPDVVHAHDWQAGLVPAYLHHHQRGGGGAAPPTVFSIHNIAYQGVFGGGVFGQLGLPREAYDVDGLEYYGNISFLKGGVQHAHRITTVSPTYAREIQTPEFGYGLDGLLRARAQHLSGILNGIDTDEWNPATDKALEATYTVDTLDAKARNKRALQADFGLDPAATGPLLCVVSRLTDQKGLDLLAAALPTLIERDGQLALIGTGDSALENAFLDLQRMRPDRIGVRIGYDETVSHRLQAGADAIVVPSRFEPCGLTQLYALRYGTVPVVARTGGLADTVIDANYAALAANTGTGVQFSPVTANALRGALSRTADLYADSATWRGMQLRGMAENFDWSRPGAEYAALYQSLL